MLKERFGTLPTGEAVDVYTLQSGEATLRVMTRGATIVNFRVGDTDIVGGFDTLGDYLADESHQGAVIGRVANRIAGASFPMDGKLYRVTKNEGNNCLHSGDGFDHRLWTAEKATDDSITFRYVSPDGEEGFPHTLDVRVTYRLEGAALLIDYTAVPDGRTPIALTNHAYFNLDGFGGTVDDHVVTIYADRYTEVNDELIPTGNHPSVDGTVFDFRMPHRIGERVGGGFVGYDHNYVLNKDRKYAVMGYELALAAEVTNGKRKMSVYTNQDGVQFYIGNFLAGKPDFRGGVPRVTHGAFCLETQSEPDCVHRGAGFYARGEVYRHMTVYRVETLR